MDECDLETEETSPRHPVDELCPRRLELLERGEEIFRFERDVVHAGAAAREETGHRRVVVRRGDELDPALADEHRRGLHTLLLERLPVLEPRVEEALVRRDRLVEIGHGDAEVMDPPHPRDATAGR